MEDKPNTLRKEISPRALRLGVISALVLIVLVTVLSNVLILYSAVGKVFSPDSLMLDSIGQRDFVIVLGASATKDHLNKVYELRVVTALDLYNRKIVRKILISGDGRGKYYDEITPAIKYLTSHDVLEEDIASDNLGLDTYDSISRASSSGVTKAFVVSQGYHLPRAIYIAKSLGMDVIGIKAPDASLGGQIFGNVREVYARVKAFIEVQARRIFG